MGLKARTPSKATASMALKAEEVSLPFMSKGTEETFPRFFDLPFELRIRIYEFALLVPSTIDLRTTNGTTIAPQLRLLRTCRRVYEEAYPIFYSENTFQIFPTHPAYLNSKPKKLLLTRLPRKYRERITSLQLRFGPGCLNPPKCQAVTPRLGLADCTSVKTLKVFVECDPSQDTFKTFRFSETFYTIFCGNLLQAVLDHVPSVKEVEIDGYPSVKRQGPLVQELVDEAETASKKVTWGPVRRFDEDKDDDSDSADCFA